MILTFDMFELARDIVKMDPNTNFFSHKTADSWTNRQNTNTHRDMGLNLIPLMQQENLSNEWN